MNRFQADNNKVIEAFFQLSKQNNTMSNFTLPPKKSANETSEKKAASVSEKKISDLINKGGGVIKKDTNDSTPVFKNFNIKILESELDAINALREKLPKLRGKRSAISLHDWIVTAIQEKIVRDSRK